MVEIVIKGGYVIKLTANLIINIDNLPIGYDDALNEIKKLVNEKVLVLVENIREMSSMNDYRMTFKVMKKEDI